MRVIRLGRENLDVELSGTAYRICGAIGGGTGFSAFAEEIYKIEEREQSVPVGERPVLSELDGQEKLWVREKVCEEWERTNPGYDIAFYDEEGNLLYRADHKMRVLTVSRSCLEIHMDGTIVRFDGDLGRRGFTALAASMTWLCPDERKAQEGEFETYVKKFKAGYRALPRKSRLRIIFVDDKGGRQG